MIEWVNALRKREDYAPIIEMIEECTAGDGFANMAFLPRAKGNPAIIIEMKMRKGPETGVRQIKDRHYADAVSTYHGDAVLVGISYDPHTEVHTCKICRESR